MSVSSFKNYLNGNCFEISFQCYLSIQGMDLAKNMYLKLWYLTYYHLVGLCKKRYTHLNVKEVLANAGVNSV